MRAEAHVAYFMGVTSLTCTGALLERNGPTMANIQFEADLGGSVFVRQLSGGSRHMSQTLDAKLHLLISSAYSVLPSIQSLEHHFQVPRPGKKSATGQVKGQLCIGSTQASFVWD